MKLFENNVKLLFIFSFLEKFTQSVKGKRCVECRVSFILDVTSVPFSKETLCPILYIFSY